MNSNSKRVAFIFGGSRGIGAASVSRLAHDGYAVAFTYVSREDKAVQLADGIVARGGKALPIKADSANPNDIRAAIAQAVEQYGQIDVLVVNAGVFDFAMIDTMPLDKLDLILNVNVRGVYLSIQAAIPHIKYGGRVITIGSNVAVRAGSPGVSAYQMSKGAVAAMVKGIAHDLAPRRITVNNVQPGAIGTDLIPDHQAAAGGTILKRTGTPEEVAGLISYLAADEAAFMTGTSITMDGGYVL
ncbi:3-oxoacyl-[acyl-carrier protein] reductase [Bradyrhizobium japonicum]